MVFPVLSWHRYVGWPAAKAHVAVLTGSLRNLQKLVTSIDDDGLLRLQLNLTNCRGFHSENTAKTLISVALSMCPGFTADPQGRKLSIVLFCGRLLWRRAPNRDLTTWIERNQAWHSTMQYQALAYLSIPQYHAISFLIRCHLLLPDMFEDPSVQLGPVKSFDSLHDDLHELQE